jgi:hypothetical protein
MTTKETRVARQFPSIVNFGSAFRFALEAEQAGADFAAAAEVAAPDEEWRTRFEELVCTHDDRVEKLKVVRQEVNEMTLEPLHGMDAERYTSVLAGEPETTWPEAGEQIARVEETIAAFHEDFVAHADDVLAAQTRAFKKAAKQNRQAAEEIRGMLG